MLSLKNKEGGVHVCDIVKGRAKPQPLYYYYDIDDALLMQVDDIEALLKSSLPGIKDKLRINQEVVNEAIALLKSDKEPADDAKGPVRRAYYFLKKKSRALLREELDLRDVPEKAVINIPTKLEEWPGTEFIAGSSGSGKGFYATSKILRHWKEASPLNRRHIFWLSPELHEDKTLRRISDFKKYEAWFTGIDISINAFETSGLSADQYFNEKVKSILQHQKNSIIVFDDFQDSAIPNVLRKYIDRLLRTGRHAGTSTWSMQHSLRNSAFSRQAVQSCKHVTLFCRSQRGKCIQFLKDSVGLSLGQSRDLVALMSQCGRSATLRMHSPMMLICDDYVKLL